MTLILVNYCKNIPLLIKFSLMNEINQTDFAVIVLNWNSCDFLKKCLNALANQSHRHFEIICVDNGSTDGSKNWLQNTNLVELLNLPVNKIFHEKNIGFAAGMNSGIRAANAKFIIPLNVDVFLDKNFLKNAKELFENNPQIHSLGAKILKYDGESTNEVICTGVSLTKNFSISTSLSDTDIEKEVFGPAGCCPIFRRDALENSAFTAENKKQFYDEIYFAYGEDVDLYLRMNLMGCKCLYSPKLLAWHAHSGTQTGIRWHTKDAATLRRLPANVFYTWLKNCPPKMLIKTAPRVFLTPLAMFFVLLFRRPAVCLAPLAAYFSFIKNLPRTLKIRKELKNKFNKNINQNPK